MILVTGATGNVGSAVVKQLIADGWAVRAFVRDLSKTGHWGDRVEPAIGDFNDPESFSRAAEAAEAILLVAAGGFADHAADLLNAARASGVERIVLISGSVAEWLASDAGEWFRNCENAVRNCGLRWTILRPCNFMSNAYQWIGTINREGLVYNPTGNSKAALIAPEDVAHVAARCLESPDRGGKTIPLTGSEAFNVPQQVQILAEVLRKPIRCVDVSVETGVDQLIRSGTAPASARSTAEIYEKMLRGEAAAITADFTGITGKQPKTFRSWVRDHREKFLTMARRD
jgi:uncharacterized protein YbjT (DUF2867 family)